MGFETFTKGMQDANEMLNRNFAAVETQLSSKAEAEPPQSLNCRWRKAGQNTSSLTISEMHSGK